MRQITLRNATRSILGLVAVLTILSCLDTAAPTPQPTLVSIVLRTKGATITTVHGTRRFQMVLRVGNASDAPIYASLNYEIEKLVDQKWQPAFVRTFAFPNTFISLPRPGGLDYSVGAEYTEGSSPPSELLGHMRGLYRARLHLFYGFDGTNPLPDDAGLSPPFAAVD